MPVSTQTLTVAETADRIGVAPARVRALIASGILRTSPDDLTAVRAAEVAELTRRGVVRSVDVAAVEGAVDRALRRRLPALLEAALHDGLEPLSREVATALADVELSVEQRAAAEERARAAEAALSQARAEVTDLRQQVVALAAQPRGLFRRRRSAGVATA